MERQLDKKLKTSSTFSGSFPSPESPEDSRAVGYPKGWYSERVPHSSNHHARKGYNATSAAIMPFSSSGRALPSKWDDAERWISSPISVGNVYNHGNYVYGPGVYKNTQLTRNYQRRAKSKSGPLGNGPPAGLGSYESYNNNTLFSPVLGVGVVNGGKWRHSLAVESRVGPEELDGGGGGGEVGRRRSYTGGHDQEWSDLWSGPISSSDKCDVNLANDGFESIKYDDNDDNNDNDENHDEYNEDGWKNEARVDRVISRRDMATQMYVESESSSQCGNSPRPLLGSNNNEPNLKAQSQEFEVKDVQIDRQTSRATQRSSSISKGRQVSTGFGSVDENTNTKTFKLRREEARINAWESLQKIKAESAIQKLEMKLETKRETMTRKIMEKLRKAEIKAQKMRISLGNDNTTHPKSSSTIHSFRRKLCWSSTC